MIILQRKIRYFIYNALLNNNAAICIKELQY